MTAGAQRYAAVDAYYPMSGGAQAALVLATDRAFTTVVAEYTAGLAEAAPYQPGQFFRRELPALLAVLALARPVHLVVIDGYVDLDPRGRPGLGIYLHSELGVPVVGVAKTPFRAAVHAAPLLRGRSTRPLFITAAGIPSSEAMALVRDMAGRHRLPDALRRVDALSRQTSTHAAKPT